MGVVKQAELYVSQVVQSSRLSVVQSVPVRSIVVTLQSKAGRQVEVRVCWYGSAGVDAGSEVAKPSEKQRPAERDKQGMIQSAAGDSLPVGSHQLASNSAKQCCNAFGRGEAVMALTADALRAWLLPPRCCSAHMCYSPLHERRTTQETQRRREVKQREFVKELVIFYVMCCGSCGWVKSQFEYFQLQDRIWQKAVADVNTATYFTCMQDEMQ